MAWGIKNLFGALGASMKDDKGLFQGGAEGVLGGRAKDLIMGLTGKSVMDRTRKFAKEFNPEDSKGVLKLQKMMNSLGITDSEGNELKEDAMLGGKTLSALRSLQRGDSEESLDYDTDYSGESVEESFDYDPRTNPAGPVDPWGEGNNMSGGSSKSWLSKLFNQGQLRG